MMLITKERLMNWGLNKMKKTELQEKVSRLKDTTKDALQLVWDNINKGQKKQILKNPEVKELMDRYGVNTDE